MIVDRSVVLIATIIVVWMALGFLAADLMPFAPQCDDVRPRGC